MPKSNRIRASKPAGDRQPEPPPKDAITQIREAKDALVAAAIAKGLEDGNYQQVKWLFEFGGVTPAGQTPPEDEVSTLRLLLKQLQIPESVEAIAAEFSSNRGNVE